MIKVVYKISFRTEPTSKVLRNYRSALNEKRFVAKKKKRKIYYEEGAFQRSVIFHKL